MTLRLRCDLMRWLRRGTAACLALVVLVLLAEAVLRIYSACYLYRHYRAVAIAATAGKEVVLCLGESSTIGIWCAPEESYPSQLAAILGREYGRDFVCAVPPHIGQNTSQMANRMESYLDLYQPKLVIIMAGVNNQWSLNENRAVGYVPDGDGRQLARLRTADGFRSWKMVRNLYLYCTENEEGGTLMTAEVLGHPVLSPFPPSAMLHELTERYRPEFRAAWRDDLRAMISAAQRRDIPVLLMTYHYLHPRFITVDDYVALGRECGVPVARNDLAFAPLFADGTVREYVQRDDWHPNARGYALIAHTAAGAVRRHVLLAPPNTGGGNG